MTAHTLFTEEGEADTSPSSAVSGKTSKDVSAKKVGLIALIAFVVSAMVGGGVFNLPADSAKAASPAVLIIAWIITGLGIWFLANTFRILADAFPQLKNGVYTYAKCGFGRLVGFLSAYGYWISNTFVLIVYSVLITQTLSRFFPQVFSDARGSFTWIDVGFSLLLLWGLFFVANRGVKQSALLNIAGTLGKLVPIILFIVVMLLSFKLSLFLATFWELNKDGVILAFSWENVGAQLGQTMMVSLFLFTGIEGAVVISGQAKNQRDVSRATLIGFILTLVLYVLVSLLPLGVYAQETIQQKMSNPSLASIMGEKFPLWGSTVVNIGIIVAVLSTGLVKLNMLGEMPLFGARDGLFPQRFDALNKRGAPTFAYVFTMVMASIFVCVVHFLSGDTWRVVINITNIMALPSYLLCALFLWKQALMFKSSWWREKSVSRVAALFTGVVATLFSVYLLYAAGLRYLFIACIFYAAGIPLLLLGQREALSRSAQRAKQKAAPLTVKRKADKEMERTMDDTVQSPVKDGSGENEIKPFSRYEKLALVTLVILGILGVIYSVTSGLF